MRHGVERGDFEAWLATSRQLFGISDGTAEWAALKSSTELAFAAGGCARVVKDLGDYFRDHEDDSRYSRTQSASAHVRSFTVLSCG